jgi:hypothetical protein
MTDILVGMFAVDIHDNVIRWVERIPVDTLESKDFWESIG